MSLTDIDRCIESVFVTYSDAESVDSRKFIFFVLPIDLVFFIVADENVFDVVVDVDALVINTAAVDLGDPGRISFFCSNLLQTVSVLLLESRKECERPSLYNSLFFLYNFQLIKSKGS